jgi:hypothetical protein
VIEVPAELGVSDDVTVNKVDGSQEPTVSPAPRAGPGNEPRRPTPLSHPLQMETRVTCSCAEAEIAPRQALNHAGNPGDSGVGLDKRYWVPLGCKSLGLYWDSATTRRGPSALIGTRSSLYCNGKRGARGIRTLDTSFPVYRISRASDQGAGWGIGGHSVFKFVALGAPQGRRRHPRWVCVETRIVCVWRIQWARGAHIQASARPSNPGQVTGRSCARG